MIDYVCTPHPGMFGMLMVGPARTGPHAAGPPRTIGALSPVALAGIGSGWLLVLTLLAAAQLRTRSGSRRLLEPLSPSEDAS
jgi:hypothetical protein